MLNFQLGSTLKLRSSHKVVFCWAINPPSWIMTTQTWKISLSTRRITVNRRYYSLTHPRCQSNTTLWCSLGTKTSRNLWSMHSLRIICKLISITISVFASRTLSLKKMKTSAWKSPTTITSLIKSKAPLLSKAQQRWQPRASQSLSLI